MPQTAHDSLSRYRAKRDFERTTEPAGDAATHEGLRYCVQKHAAGRLHYDFRIELDGVLKSWAVPKGPSLVPGQRRLAVAVEDHPVEYGEFEGVIPEGEYGGGTVLLWDRGVWSPIGDPHRGLRAGKLEFELHGEKLRGKFVLVKLKDEDAQWLLLKSRDDHAEASGAIIDAAPRSVATDRDLAEIAADGDATTKQRARARAADGGKASEPKSKPSKAKAQPSKAKAQPSKAKAKAQPSKPKAKPSKPRARQPKSTQADAADAQSPPPEFIEPQLAQLVDTPPTGDDWLHEIKLDGYRMLCRVDGDDVTLLSRNRTDWTAKLPEIVRAIGALQLGSAFFDGELVALAEDGRTVFSTLVQRLNQGGGRGLTYHVFDLLHEGGVDLRSTPLVQRKARLEALCAAADPVIRYTAHYRGEGPAFFVAAQQHGLEGIISKRAEGAHHPGRKPDWRKIKCRARQEFVVVGTTPPTHANDGFGALLLAVRDGDGWVYAGRVGTGFDRAMRRRVQAALEPLATDACPLSEPPRGPGMRRVRWVSPSLVVEVAFTEWTPDGRLRHPAFMGMREDKSADVVVREVAADLVEPPAQPRIESAASNEGEDEPAGVQLTNPDKVLVADVGLTKRALAQYYAAVASAMLPHLSGRPVMLLRCPDGTAKPCFYQKHAGTRLPDGIVSLALDEADGETALMVESAQGLVGTVQMGALELHIWGSHQQDVERPTRIVMDLDPDPSLDFDAVVEAAMDVRAGLAEAGLESFVMSTGGKGLHVVAPILAAADFAAVKPWTRAFAEAMVQLAPKRYVATASKQRRRGKIFLDYLRNGRGATAICPYSTRARPGALVAAPLTWDELAAHTEAPALDIAAVRERVAGGIDPWAGYAELRQRLP